MLTLSIIFSLLCCIGYIVFWSSRAWLGWKYRRNPDGMVRYGRVFDTVRWVLLGCMLLGVIFYVISVKTGNYAAS